MGRVELKIINRGVILVEQRGHERGSVIGRHVFECVLVQRGTAMHTHLTKGMVQVSYKCTQWPTTVAEALTGCPLSCLRLERVTGSIIETFLMSPPSVTAPRGSVGEVAKIRCRRRWSKLTMEAAGAPYMIWECPRPLYAPQRAMGATFSDFPILTLTAPTVPVQWWSGRAVGRGPEHHNDDCCDHSHAQSAQWAPIGHCHNSSWL